MRIPLPLILVSFSFKQHIFIERGLLFSSLLVQPYYCFHCVLLQKLTSYFFHPINKPLYELSVVTDWKADIINPDIIK